MSCTCAGRGPGNGRLGEGGWEVCRDHHVGGGTSTDR